MAINGQGILSVGPTATANLRLNVVLADGSRNGIEDGQTYSIMNNGPFDAKLFVRDPAALRSIPSVYTLLPLAQFTYIKPVPGREYTVQSTKGVTTLALTEAP